MMAKLPTVCVSAAKRSSFSQRMTRGPSTCGQRMPPSSNARNRLRADVLGKRSGQSSRMATFNVVAHELMTSAPNRAVRPSTTAVK